MKKNAITQITIAMRLWFRARITKQPTKTASNTQLIKERIEETIRATYSVECELEKHNVNMLLLDIVVSCLSYCTTSHTRTTLDAFVIGVPESYAMMHNFSQIYQILKQFFLIEENGVQNWD